MKTKKINPPAARAGDDRDGTIVSAAIHPAIGIARVGDSKKEYFLCPEVLNPPPERHYRDADGALMRQAVKFRLFGYNAAGKVVRELTAQDGEISWTVRVANKKAAWYQFRGALDIEETRTTATPRRNPPVPGYAESDWIIDSGDCTVRVKGKRASRRMKGSFLKESVKLGEIRVVEKGRLLVLGGEGRSKSPLNLPVCADDDDNTHGNAAGWFDDTSDGPVTATVVMGKKSIPVTPAWVIVAPPNYAPGIVPWRTLYDVLEEAFIREEWLEKPAAVSFVRHVLPKLQRLSGLQWVNAGFAALFGKGAPFDFENPQLIRKLCQRPGKNGSDPFKGLRRSIFIAFRPSKQEVDDPRLWPWFYADGVLYDDMTTPNTYLALSPLEEERLKSWAEGDFVNDWRRNAARPRKIEDVNERDQPAMLDEAALTDCVAHAFRPGHEVSWTLRHLSMFETPERSAKPFRIRRRLLREPDYGPVLTQELVARPDGPLSGQAPGDITRWLALPWQADIPYCRSGYNWKRYHPHLPAFWPGKVPNQVLKEKDYAVLKTKASRQALVQAFQTRDFWLRDIIAESTDQQTPPTVAMTNMLNNWSKVGIVQAKQGHVRHPSLPAVIYVETLPRPKMQKRAGR